MKKQTAIIAFMLVFLLAACGTPETAPSETEVLFTATETSPAETEIQISATGTVPLETETQHATETIPQETETQPATEPAPQTIVPVEITLDNWQEYFELRQTEQVYVSESCGVTNRVFGYGVFLKEEFLPLLAPGSDISFELQYEVVWKRVMGDLTGDSYMIIGSVNEVHPKTQLAQMTDFRENAEIPEDSDFYGQVAVEFAYDSEFGA